MQYRLDISDWKKAKALKSMQNDWLWDSERNLFYVMIEDKFLTLTSDYNDNNEDATWEISKNHMPRNMIALAANFENAAWVATNNEIYTWEYENPNTIHASIVNEMPLSEIPEMAAYNIVIKLNDDFKKKPNSRRPKINTKNPIRRPKVKK